MVGGANKQCNLHTKEGVKLGTIGDQQSWVWAATVRPDSNFVVSFIRSVVAGFNKLHTKEGVKLSPILDLHCLPRPACPDG